MTTSEVSSGPADAALSLGRFVDVQVNGYAGHDFNDAELSADAWHEACARLRGDGIRRSLGDDHHGRGRDDDDAASEGLRGAAA